MQSRNIEKHTLTSSQIYIGDGIIECIDSLLFDEFREGVLLVVYDKKLSEINDKIVHILKRAGITINNVFIESYRRSGSISTKDVVEYARHVLAIGSGSVARFAKNICQELNIDFSLVLSAPTCNDILSDICPKQVFIDKNVLINCPNECIAAGYGNLLSYQLTAFEKEWNKLIMADKNEIEQARDYQELDVVALTLEVLRLSCFKKGIDSADIMANILYHDAIAKGIKPRLFGEYRAIASATILSFYYLFLGTIAIDSMPSRDIVEDSKKLCNLCKDFVDYQKKIDFLDTNVYFRISYMLGEYRTDLLDKLSRIDTHSMWRYFRRQYDDAMYHLKCEIGASTMLKCMALAGAYSDNLLGFAYTSGVMNRF